MSWDIKALFSHPKSCLCVSPSFFAKNMMVCYYLNVTIRLYAVVQT